MGEGARCADAVVNAIYEGASPHHNVFAGKEYVCLRDEFVASKPADYSEDVHRILCLLYTSTQYAVCCRSASD